MNGGGTGNTFGSRCPASWQALHNLRTVAAVSQESSKLLEAIAGAEHESPVSDIDMPLFLPCLILGPHPADKALVTHSIQRPFFHYPIVGDNQMPKALQIQELEMELLLKVLSLSLAISHGVNNAIDEFRDQIELFEGGDHRES